MKHEKDFAEKIERENRWTAWRAIGLAILVGGISLGMLLLFRDEISDAGFWKVTAVVLLLVGFACWATWAIRGMERSDLYVVARGKSLTELRRYHGEIEELIDKIEAEREIKGKIVAVNRKEQDK